MRRHRSSRSWLWIIAIVVVTLVFVLIRNSSRSEQPAAPAAATPTPTSLSRTAAQDMASPATGDPLMDDSIRLAQTYLLVYPDDTPESRWSRLQASGMPVIPAEVRTTLDLAVGTMSCADRARLDPQNPLVQKAVLQQPPAINKFTLGDGATLVYVTVAVRVSFFDAKGKRFISNDCVVDATPSIAVAWVINNGTRTLSALVSPGGSTL